VKISELEYLETRNFWLCRMIGALFVLLQIVGWLWSVVIDELIDLS